MPPPTIFSVGHSNHDIETFLTLLRLHEIECVIDVRSSPYSRYSPHFRKRSLEGRLRSEGLEYMHLGQSLGGRPRDRSCYDAAGTVDYQRIASKPWYRESIEILVDIANDRRIALMCSEENPERCHRQHLISSTLLRETRAQVRHIRGDGRVERATLSPVQGSLL